MVRRLAGILIAAVICSLSPSLPLRAQWVTVSTTGDRYRHVLIEEFTGTWGGFAPLADLRLDTLHRSFPEATIVAIHAASAVAPATALQTEEGTRLARRMVRGYPSAVVDRATDELSSTDWWTYVDQRKMYERPLDLSITARLDEQTRTVESRVRVTFLPVSQQPGRYVLHLYLVEDSVTGGGADYDQRNEYNDVVDSPFRGAGDPIPGYVHRHVLRLMVTGLDGDSTKMPRLPTAGLICNASYSFPLPAGVNPARTSLVAFVENTEVPEVLNSLELRFGTPLADVAASRDGRAAVSFAPQPARGELSARLELPVPGSVRIELVDALGRGVRTVELPDLEAGSHRVPIDLTDLPAGPYLARIEAPGLRRTERLVVAR